MHSVGTSNLLALIPHPSSPHARPCPGKHVVAATAAAHVEVREARPGLEALRQTLAACPVTEQEAEGSSAGHPPPPGARTRDELLADLPISPAELDAALEGLGAFVMDGRWRVLDARCCAEVVKMVLLTVVEHGWTTFRVPRDEAIEKTAKADLRAEVVAGALAAVAAPTPGGAEGELAIDMARVAKVHARALLCGRAEWPAAELETAVRTQLPEEARDSVDVAGALRGEAVTVGQPGAPVTVALPAYALTTEPAARFQAMFAVKQRWTRQEMAPYLEGLDVPGVTDEELLLRYARETKGGGDVPATWSARYSFQ
ncbi:unnamed protein product [Pedinophyceae sp. YPF-701]|nr:unnamed protein product [Pedinophyceae sp. YPF-701]